MNAAGEKDRTRMQARMRNTVVVLVGIAAGMAGLAYAAVPLYDLFCRVTGYGGTTQAALEAPGVAGERVIRVQFDANTARGLGWHFKPEQRSIDLKIGEEKLAFYRAENRTDHAITGTATFNVTPHKAGLYFSKIECFCFTEQRLEPGESVDMPVTFFIDPAIMDDPNLDDVTQITLSYTMYPADPPQTAHAGANGAVEGGGELN
ncbi:cytochrome c oxidase assembly protein [Futiania mangrovi]|uniref:Cytochrome c oxidase assembly protein CtaG n=1 Tax=Futiania mangrovi TaxID=2959716 RepID=A0A9J6PIH6_9PROT|nr:cytochrome c oxidase assembly protein [Futiania mangrovii]MCP1337608.1 cytochrome c oxidase assembly protein [Futiania mangrovii]